MPRLAPTVLELREHDARLTPHLNQQIPSQGTPAGNWIGCHSQRKPAWSGFGRECSGDTGGCEVRGSLLPE